VLTKPHQLLLKGLASGSLFGNPALPQTWKQKSFSLPWKFKVRFYCTWAFQEAELNDRGHSAKTEQGVGMALC
jgi:trehalose/maltose hydrolase-like predicted phosphorylase